MGKGEGRWVGWRGRGTIQEREKRRKGMAEGREGRGVERRWEGRDGRGVERRWEDRAVLC